MYTYNIIEIQILSPCFHTNHLKSYFFYNYIRYTWLGSNVETLSTNHGQGLTRQEEQLTEVRKKSLNPAHMHQCCLTPRMAFNFTDIYLLQLGRQTSVSAGRLD